jgi:transcriptional regulator with XRE-family HTH domain
MALAAVTNGGEQATGPVFDPVSRRFDGPRLHSALLERGLTTKRVSKVTGLSHNTIARAMESEMVREDTVVKLYRILDDFPRLHVS